jgi:predicted N-acetyltransferase YhbS
MKRTVPSAEGARSTSSCVTTAGTALAAPKVQFTDPHSTDKSSVSSNWSVSSASAGDHIAILHFLQSVAHQPSATDYQAQLEDPTYEPSDRLLVKQNRTIVGHVRLINREMHLGSQLVPVTLLSDFVVAPEYRRFGCEGALLRRARRAMLKNGATIGLTWSPDTPLLMRHGWSPWNRQHHSAANPRRILSCLAARLEQESSLAPKPFSRPDQKRYNIRLWRQVELAALQRLYSENIERLWGPLERSTSYWRWLIGRGGNERIYVAIDGPDQFELDDSLAPIIGYAATRKGRLMEIMCSGDHPQAAVQLLERACGDAIERGIDRVEVEAPSEDPLHAMLAAAGGNRCYMDPNQRQTQLVTLLKPQRLVGLLGRLFADRLSSADIPVPNVLGIQVDGERTSFTVLEKGVEWKVGKLGRSYLTCSAGDLAPLLLGQIDVREAVEAGRLRPSTRVALELAETLFPRVPLWRPPWDEQSA